PADKGWAAVTSLILGIISLLSWCFPICGIPIGLGAAVFGFLGRKSTKNVMATVGLVLGVIGVIVGIIIWALSPSIAQNLQQYLQQYQP
ncbi:MAG TPA: hypothetical protein PKD55_24250, partial [Bellilinea sp.]|nr:hypothetical protein [Bellilinea sp.]